MAATMNIPLAALAPGGGTGPGGEYDFPASGGAAITDTDRQVTLTIDRTVAGGFNAVSSAVSVAIEIWQSVDGGASWQNLVTATWTGGTPPAGARNPDQNILIAYLAPGASRLARAVVRVSGGSIAVQGSLVIA